MDDEYRLEHILQTDRVKKGFLKCRMIHMKDRTFVQPDILFGGGLTKKYFVPKFFDPNAIAFTDEDGANDFCRLTLVTDNGVTLQIAFFRRDKIKNCSDGSIIYRCGYKSLDLARQPVALGKWRRRDADFQLRLFHHTTDEGRFGILKSGDVWGSKWNIQGNLQLQNIAYGYFTCVSKIKDEEDLLKIAMSESGLTRFVPTNAPFDPHYSTTIIIPKQKAIDRSQTLAFWASAEIIAPNHLWLHRPMDSPAYYEIVLPHVFRIGVRPSATIPFKSGILKPRSVDQKVFEYVIVGDADTHEGLEAPYHEEETSQIAKIEKIPSDSDIIEIWKKLKNSDQFSGKEIEFATLERHKGEKNLITD